MDGCQVISASVLILPSMRAQVAVQVEVDDHLLKQVAGFHHVHQNE